MSITRVLVAPLAAAAGVGLAVMMAPSAGADIDECTAAVSSSRCLGPSGIADFPVPSAGGGGAMNGPYGPWGSIPPIG